MVNPAGTEKACFVCGESFEPVDLEPSPSGSGKLVCAGCAEDIQNDLDEDFNEE